MHRLLIRHCKVCLGRTKVKVILGLIVAQLILYLIYQQGVSRSSHPPTVLHVGNADDLAKNVKNLQKSQNSFKARGNRVINPQFLGNQQILGKVLSGEPGLTVPNQTVFKDLVAENATEKRILFQEHVYKGDNKKVQFQIGGSQNKNLTQSNKDMQKAEQKGRLPSQKQLSQKQLGRNDTSVDSNADTMQNRTLMARKFLQAFTSPDLAARRQKYKDQLESATDPPVMSRACTNRGSGRNITNMVFVKVHKSASTTVANILARYALRHSLNVALPNKQPGTHRFNYFDPKITWQGLIPAPPGENYHVMFNHMIFNRRNIEAVMPNTTFYFAIMRDPEDRFLSSLFYYDIAKLVAHHFSLPGGVQEAVRLILRYPTLVNNNPEYYNSLAGDTGLDASSQNKPRAVEEHIHKLEQDLDLMLVVEYFDESLILLRRKACLAMKDILYVRKNAGLRTTPIHLTSEDRKYFQKHQMADVIMYEHFYKRFWELVLAEGPDFFQEVRAFREIQRGVSDFCTTVISVWDFYVVEPTVWNEEFLVTARECRLMGMTELDMQTYLIDRARTSYLTKFRGKQTVSEKAAQPLQITE